MARDVQNGATSRPHLGQTLDISVLVDNSFMEFLLLSAQLFLVELCARHVVELELAVERKLELYEPLILHELWVDELLHHDLGQLDHIALSEDRQLSALIVDETTPDVSFPHIIDEGRVSAHSAGVADHTPKVLQSR